MRGYARKPLCPAVESRGLERSSSYSYLVRHLSRRVLRIFCLTPRMSYGRRQTTDAKLADTLSKTERLTAVSSILFDWVIVLSLSTRLPQASQTTLLSAARE